MKAQKLATDEDAPPPHRVPSWVVWALLAQTVGFVVLVAATVCLHSAIVAKTGAVVHTLTTIEAGGEVPPHIIRAFSTTAAEAVNAFFLGSPTGLLPIFAQSVLGFDFGALARSVFALASSVQQLNWKMTTNCGESLICPFGQTHLTCANGVTVFCEEEGQVIQCSIGTAECLKNSFLGYASMVQSFVTPMTAYVPVGSSNSSGAAFSNGLLRVDVFPAWLSAQLSTGDWKAVGGACQQFATQLNGMSWDFSYISTDGQPTSASIQSAVSSVTSYATEVCKALTLLD